MQVHMVRKLQSDAECPIHPQQVIVAGELLIRRAVLCTEGHLAVPLVSTHWMQVALCGCDNWEYFQALAHVPWGTKLFLVEQFVNKDFLE
jgi:hypothetical protein